MISYSLSPERNIRRVMETSVYSIGSAPSVLSMVSVTSARPSGARPAVPAKITSSILPPRSAFAPCSPEHPGDGVDHVGLAGAVRAHHAGDARLQPQRRRGREGLETLHRQALEMHGSPECRSGRRGGTEGWCPVSAGYRRRRPGSRQRRGPNASAPSSLAAQRRWTTEPGQREARRRGVGARCVRRVEVVDDLGAGRSKRVPAPRCGAGRRSPPRPRPAGRSRRGAA